MTFKDWLKTHQCDTKTLWTLQNCLTAILGWNNKHAKAAYTAWLENQKAYSSADEAMDDILCDCKCICHPEAICGLSESLLSCCHCDCKDSERPLQEPECKCGFTSDSWGDHLAHIWECYKLGLKSPFQVPEKCRCGDAFCSHNMTQEKWEDQKPSQPEEKVCGCFREINGIGTFTCDCHLDQAVKIMQHDEDGRCLTHDPHKECGIYMCRGCNEEFSVCKCTTSAEWYCLSKPQAFIEKLPKCLHHKLCDCNKCKPQAFIGGCGERMSDEAAFRKDLLDLLYRLSVTVNPQSGVLAQIRLNDIEELRAKYVP